MPILLFNFPSPRGRGVKGEVQEVVWTKTTIATTTTLAATPIAGNAPDDLILALHRWPHPFTDHASSSDTAAQGALPDSPSERAVIVKM